MRYKQTLVDILDDLIDGMTFPVTIFKVASVGSTYTLNVDDIYHAQAGRTVTIGGNDYVIVSWTDITIRGGCQTWALVVTGSSAITVTTFNMYPPYFFHGTPVETGTEIAQESNSFNKYPMIYLWENYKEKFFDDPQDQHDRDTEARIFFLTDADFTLQTEGIRLANVEPMRRLMENFIEVINNTYTTFEKWDMSYTVEPYNKFGIYLSGKGVAKSLFVDKLSGLELTIPLKILKTNECC